MLTPSQVAHFEAFGFLRLCQAFSPAEIGAITREAEAVWREDRQRRGITSDYQTVAPFVERRSALSALAEDDRIYLAVEQLLGPGFIWSGSEGNIGLPDDRSFFSWHSDRPGESGLNYRRVKVMLYLTPMARETGCLRVIPGSHRSPLYEALGPLNEHAEDASRQLFGMPGEELPGFPVESEPGDFILFHHNLFHAVVYQGDGKRRYIALKYAAWPETEAQVASLWRPPTLRAGTRPYAFEPEPSFLISDRPRIRRMVERLPELASLAARSSQLAARSEEWGTPSTTELLFPSELDSAGSPSLQALPVSEACAPRLPQNTHHTE